MEKDTPQTLCDNPLTVWTDLAWKTCEMMMASAEVVGRRTGRMAVAGPIPDPEDQNEFALMGREKFEAAAESARAMAEYVMTMNRELRFEALRQVLKGSTAMISLASCTSVGRSLERQAELFHTVTRSAITASQFPGSAALLAQRAVDPVYTRTKANALRLSGCKSPPDSA